MTNNNHVDDNIRDIVKRIRGYKSEIEQLDAKINDLKEELRQLLETRGDNWTDSEGYARLVPEGERSYYDTESLDKLIINDPLHYGWLTDYRLTSALQSHIQVK